MKAHLFIWQDTLRHSSATAWWGTTVSTVLMLARYSLRGHSHNGHLYRRSGWVTGPHRPIMPACNYSARRRTRWWWWWWGGYNVFVNIWAEKFFGRNPCVEGGEWKRNSRVAQERFGECSLIKKPGTICPLCAGEMSHPLVTFNESGSSKPEDLDPSPEQFVLHGPLKS